MVMRVFVSQPALCRGMYPQAWVQKIDDSSGNFA